MEKPLLFNARRREHGCRLEQEHALHPDAWRMYVECYEKTTYPPSAEFLVLVIDAYLKGECDRTSLNAAVEQARQHFEAKGEPWVRQAKPGKSARLASKSTKLAASKSDRAHAQSSKRSRLNQSTDVMRRARRHNAKSAPRIGRRLAAARKRRRAFESVSAVYALFTTTSSLSSSRISVASVALQASSATRCRSIVFARL